jgi:transposase-like protein
MPRPRRKTLVRETPLTPVPAEILDQFVREGPISPEELDAAVRRFKKALIERALGGELTHHLGYLPGGPEPDDVTNHRNGTSGKRVLTDEGQVAIEAPRDREGTFEPRLLGKHERRFTGFDDKVLALYARGMTVREIQGFLADMYGDESLHGSEDTRVSGHPDRRDRRAQGNERGAGRDLSRHDAPDVHRPSASTQSR